LAKIWKKKEKKVLFLEKISKKAGDRIDEFRILMQNRGIENPRT